MELYVEGLANTLAKKGVELTLVTRAFGGHPRDERRGCMRVIRVPFVSGFYLRNPTFNFMSFVRSLRLDFDVIISNGEVANFFGLMLSRMKRKPIIMVSHGLASEQPQYNRVLRLGFGIIDRMTYPKADAVVTHAPHQMRKISGKMHIVMPGVDRTRLKRPNPREAAESRKKYASRGESVIVYTGRLVEVKGVEYLIRCLRFVKKRHVCIIVGDGPDMEKCRRLAADEKANVVFTGFRNDVANLLSMADAFVLPSLSESLNYSMVEAAYMGIPIVCTDIGIIGRDCASLAKPSDEKSLAKAINEALSEKNGIRTKNAREFALRFDWDSAAKEYMRVMESVVKK
jgi:glycosyltransferase involved in cell wall biosynthesis